MGAGENIATKLCSFREAFHAGINYTPNRPIFCGACDRMVTTQIHPLKFNTENQPIEKEIPNLETIIFRWTMLNKTNMKNKSAPFFVDLGIRLVTYPIYEKHPAKIEGAVQGI